MTAPTPPALNAPARRRDAQGSRRALLEAARSLFTERGFDRTTIRDIGDRAGLDPTLIARYFGSKAALYLQILRTDFAAVDQHALGDLLQPDRMAELLARVGRNGPGPIIGSALRSDADPAVRDEAQAALSERIVDPLEHRLTASGVPDARLRAEIVAAAFIGVAVSRHTGSLPMMSGASTEQITELLVRAFGELAAAPPE